MFSGGGLANKGIGQEGASPVLLALSQPGVTGQTTRRCRRLPDPDWK